MYFDVVIMEILQPLSAAVRNENIPEYDYRTYVSINVGK